MKRLILITAGVLLTSVATTTPAQADTPGCVTKGEYRNVHKGMTKKRVHRIFDTRGVRTAFTTSEIRHYKPCNAYGTVQVSYRDGRLIAKSGQWISV